jgi:hypothetical protein
MSPLPGAEFVNPEMFNGLRGRDFTFSVKTVDSLISNTDYVVFSPPLNKVTLEIAGVDIESLDIGISKALLMKRKSDRSLESDLELLAEHVTPLYPSEIDKNKLLENIFNISLHFDPVTKNVSVKRNNRNYEGFEFAHHGSNDSFSELLRHVIGAIAISKDELWNTNIQKNGFVFGVINESSNYSLPWKIEPIGIYLPDPDHVLNSWNEKGVLNEISFDVLSRIINGESANQESVEYFKSLSPVGIFLDATK